jgi:hypothetical protein
MRRKSSQPNFRSGYVVIYVALAACLSCFAFAASASAVVFKPAGHQIEIAAPSPEFTFGGAAIVCPTLEAKGTLSEPASGVAALGVPKFAAGSCSTSGLGGIAFEPLIGTEPSEPWTLEAKSSTSVALTLPLGKAPRPQPVYFKSGSCEVFVKIGPITGIWFNGTDGTPLATASRLNFIKAESFANESGSCPAAVHEALKSSGFKILWSSVFAVKDLTAPSKAVKVE